MRPLEKRKLLSAALVFALGLCGCLRKETSHTLYLEPDGAVTWMVIEENIRSDKNDRNERAAEENRYLDAFLQATDPLTRALTRLGVGVDTAWLRTSRPYATLREARFETLESLLDSLLHEYRLAGEIEIEEAGAETRLRLLFWDPEYEEEREAGMEEELLALFDGSYHFVLTEGRFLDARGFRLEADHTEAILELEKLEELEEEGTLELRLSWTYPDRLGSRLL